MGAVPKGREEPLARKGEEGEREEGEREEGEREEGEGGEGERDGEEVGEGGEGEEDEDADEPTPQQKAHMLIRRKSYLPQDYDTVVALQQYHAVDQVLVTSKET